MPGMDLGIDLGTSQVVIYVEGKGIVLHEPSIMALDSRDDHIIACGKEAYDMQGRNPDSIKVIRPLSKGVISDYDYAEQMLRYFVRKVCAFKVFKPRAAVSLPASVTEVEQRSVVEAITASGVRKVVLMEDAVAAAIGAGLDIAAPRGSMVVDIGAGTTDIAVMSLKGIASSTSVRVGGNDMDEAIVRYIHNHYNLAIGLLTAEVVKKLIGSADGSEDETVYHVRGRDATTGLPAVRDICGADIREAIADMLQEILAAVQNVLENTPPELVGDILYSGITMTGGGSLLKGMDRLIAEKTRVECHVAENPETCVARGTGKALKYVGVISSGVYDIGQFTYRLTDSMNTG